jgi:hypothetical protein
MLADRCQVAIKLEAIVGIAETLAAANVIMATERPTWEGSPDVIERNVLSASPSKRGMVIGTRMAKISFKMFQRGTSGAPTDPANLPDWVVPARACGLTCVVSGVGPNEITTATPASLGTIVTATLAVYRDGKQYLIHGAVGNVKKTYTVGSPVLLEFEFQGIYNTPTDVALLVPTYTTIIEPPFTSAALTVLGFATPKIKALAIDLGNKITPRAYPNTASGILSYVITGRDPSGSIDVEEELAGTKDWHAALLAGTTGSIATGTFPSTGTNYNQISDTYPKVQIKKSGHADRDGLVTTPLDFEPLANSDAGNDEFSWVQT